MFEIIAFVAILVFLQTFCFHSISNEMSAIFSDLNFLVITVESVQNYIDASTDAVPKLPDHMAEVERFCFISSCNNFPQVSLRTLPLILTRTITRSDLNYYLNLDL